jgi:hypothetical protein
VSASLVTVSYIAATILFILSLGGLSNPESSRRGNLFGIIGMTLAVLATIFGPQVTPAGYTWIVGAMAAGAAVGLYAARVVRMTQMPELVASMHSLVGLAAVLVGFANYIDPAGDGRLVGAEKTLHEVEIYLGILIGATDWDDKPGGVQPPKAVLAGPKPEFFFVPTYAAARLKEAPDLGAAMQRDLRAFYPASRSLVTARTQVGADAVLQSWARLAAGEAAPDEGLVHRFAPA